MNQETPRPSATPEVKWWPLSPQAEPPTLATDGSFGYDLRLLSPLVLPPGYTILVHTGLAVELPNWLGMLILPRSGRATKDGVDVANSPGLIDADYRGEILVALYNRSAEKRTYAPGTAVAQAVFIPLLRPKFVRAQGGVTARGAGGFGSTDQEGKV